MLPLAAGHPIGGVLDESGEAHHVDFKISDFRLVEVADFISDSSGFFVAFRGDRLFETRAEFFDPLICTVPRRGFPPVTIIFSIAPSLVKAIYGCCVSPQRRFTEAPLQRHGNDHSFVPLQILQHLRDRVVRADKQLLDSRALPVAHFERDEPGR